MMKNQTLLGTDLWHPDKGILLGGKGDARKQGSDRPKNKAGLQDARILSAKMLDGNLHLATGLSQ